MPEPSENVDWHLCEWSGCDDAYESAEELADHLEQTHCTRAAIDHSTNMFHCKWPECWFSRAWDSFKIKRHLRTHTGVKVPCDKCGAIYARQYTMQRHRKDCNGVPPRSGPRTSNSKIPAGGHREAVDLAVQYRSASTSDMDIDNDDDDVVPQNAAPTSTVSTESTTQSQITPSIGIGSASLITPSSAIHSANNSQKSFEGLHKETQEDLMKTLTALEAIGTRLGMPDMPVTNGHDAANAPKPLTVKSSWDQQV
ncbi:hypothetical protein BKA62DRAFT_695905 [Auriculariales sp. MPI-PUGE-AT-0066]|nr:hypothetical protein BKA62DRAFT_695905 [Auriculariales sp. MPI-PUGE-AT-0066]